MIDKFYIDVAKRIRKDFIKLTDELNDYESMVGGLADRFKKTSEDMKSLVGKKNSESSNLVNEVMSRMTMLEEESNKVTKYIDDINKKIEKLRDEEISLYDKIKSSYPRMSDDDIKGEIQSQL